MINSYNITLADTIPYMLSEDWKTRYIGEYWQTKIRYDKLHNMTVKYEADTLDFAPNCPLDTLKEQATYMGMYLNKLEIRAAIENIDLKTPLNANKIDNKSLFAEENENAIDKCECENQLSIDDKFTNHVAFRKLAQMFYVDQKVLHKGLFGYGIIKGIWYNVEDNGLIGFTMEVKWQNGAKVFLDSRNPEEMKIISALNIHPYGGR